MILTKLELAGNHLMDQSLMADGGNGPFEPLTSLKELSLETNQLSTIPSLALTSQKNTLINLNLGLNQVRQHSASIKCLFVRSFASYF